jgi:inhibitor of cysteine peptidase
MKYLAIIAIAVILLSIGISYANVGRTPGCIPVFNESFNKEAVFVNNSSLFIVSLSENPSTGFIWNNTTSSGLKVITSVFIPQSDLLGAPGNETWLVKANQTGNQSFIARLVAPNGTVVDTFSIKVVVS